ncbi:hypothetical protein D5F01_LYC03717 [Larimichthys crocea]|uniref:Uncharacterized protein n=1 Tax=Larimichthys crocea TaxID=215358 RepID=A0A6G0J0N7_LARCR|nr:hypothetical protein D5F01_LYC03717 [Larimichthys crocea]
MTPFWVKGQSRKTVKAELDESSPTSRHKNEGQLEDPRASSLQRGQPENARASSLQRDQLEDPGASKRQRGHPKDARALKCQRVQPSQPEEPRSKLQVVKNKDRVFKRSKRPSTAVIPEYAVYRPNAAECKKQSCPNPLDVFLLMYPPTLREITVEMSNLYST